MLIYLENGRYFQISIVYLFISQVEFYKIYLGLYFSQRKHVGRETYP